MKRKELKLPDFILDWLIELDNQKAIRNMDKSLNDLGKQFRK